MITATRVAPSLTLGAIVSIAGCSSSSPAPAPERVGATSQAIDMICGEAPSATLDGLPVYEYCGDFDVWTDNGVDTRSTGGAGWTQTEGGYGYQCVEWAVRYFYFKWNVPHGWFVAYAKDMCSSYPAGVSKTNAPVHGDLAVFTPGACGADATAGHVAAIESVAASTITVVQEHPAGTVTWNKSCVMCYLHAAANGAANDPCSTAPENGDYCGQSNQWGGGTKDVLYDCEGGVTKTKTPCPYGCQVEPLGMNDKCKDAPPSDGGSDGEADAATADGAAKPRDAGGDAGEPPPRAGDGAAGEDGGAGDGSSPAGSGGGCAVGGRAGDAGLGAAVVASFLAVARRRRDRAADRR